MERVFELFKDGTFRTWYLAGGIALMVLPVVVLQMRYNAALKRTAAGRELLRRQDEIRGRPRKAGQGFEQARDVLKGKYGAEAGVALKQVYWGFGIWIVVLALYMGLMIWADEVNRVVSG